MNFEQPKMQNPKSFFRYILNAVDLLPDQVQDWESLTEILSNYLQKPTILLMDNIKKGLQVEELEVNFWWNLRYLANQVNCLGFCVVSRYPLDELAKLAENLGKASPFFNTFSQFQLEPFTEEEARELLKYSPKDLSENDIQWILEQSQCWPFLIQILLKTRLEEDGENWQAVGKEKIRLVH